MAVWGGSSCQSVNRVFRLQKLTVRKYLQNCIQQTNHILSINSVRNVAATSPIWLLCTLRSTALSILSAFLKTSSDLNDLQQARGGCFLELQYNECDIKVNFNNQQNNNICCSYLQTVRQSPLHVRNGRVLLCAPSTYIISLSENIIQLEVLCSSPEAFAFKICTVSSKLCITQLLFENIFYKLHFYMFSVSLIKIGSVL